MDGVLIGITGAAGPGATIIMAGSLCVKMSFVGLTLDTACHGMPYGKAIPAALAGLITFPSDVWSHPNISTHTNICTLVLQ